ncbi:MAG: DUF3299 domain-containing protein [Pseudomonadota bacterium]
MKPWIPLLLLLAALGARAADDYKVGDRLPTPAKAETAKAKFKETSWDDLLPKGWDPMASFKGIDLNKLNDSDPRADEALRNLRKAWDAAPANEAMNGAPIRIAGFLVPLEWGDKAMKEFLLVPYFGACIHVPPPPANQIIHVIADQPAKDVKAMEAVWVEGTLELGLADTAMGRSSYRMKARSVAKYKK